MSDGFCFSQIEFRSGPGLRLMLPVASIAAMLLASAAQAMPVAKTAVAETHILQVRDGCGQGMRYSERRDGCVEDFDGGPRGYYDRGAPPPPPMYDRRPPPPPEYSRGPDRGDSDVAAGALIGGAVGALIGSSIRNDADQRQGRR